MSHLVERIQRDSSGPVDFTRCISLWTFDIMASLVYGGSGFESRLLDTDDPLELALECKTAMVAFEFLGHIPWLFHILKHFPSSNFRRFEIFCTERVAERTDVGSVSFQDVFSYWLDPSSVLDKNDLAIETETALIAGSETPASIISLLFFFLLTHSDWHEKLCEELDNTFRTGNANFDFDTLAELPILNAVILEGFRLGAVFSGLPRKTPPDGVFLENHFLPSGTIVSVPIFAYHTDESIFPGPDSFNPARWLDDGQNRFSKNQLLTFGAGPFKCIGVKIAYRLTRLAISRILLDMDLKLPKDFDGDLFWGSVGNLRSTVFKKPLHVQVTSRQL
ncbi:hypothetical protein VNI00_000694 [Paramarasmius palmivorus]|uniref:Cytochrome P450 n=1 Tax=Paramarasmius palmivorus TaxID=297713 RepID=A0AAW0E9V6_9AGAR